MTPSGFYFGKNTIPEKLFKMINKKIDLSFKYNVLIGYAQAEEDAEKLKTLFKNTSDIFKNVRVLELGGALGVHAGPGAISVGAQKINDES